MDMPKNKFKAALKAKEPQIGLWAHIPSNYSAEIIEIGRAHVWSTRLNSSHIQKSRMPSSA